MVFRIYSIGIMAAAILFLTGFVFYTRDKDQSFGKRSMMFAGAIALALVWPVSLPATIAFTLKMLYAQMYKKLIGDVDEKIS